MLSPLESLPNTSPSCKGEGSAVATLSDRCLALPPLFHETETKRGTSEIAASAPGLDWVQYSYMITDRRKRDT